MNFKIMFLCKTCPTFLYLLTAFCQMLMYFKAFVFLYCCYSSSKANTFSPECTTDKCILCMLHKLFPSNNGCNRVTVTHTLSKNSHVRMDTKIFTCSTTVKTEAASYLIYYQWYA